MRRGANNADVKTATPDCFCVIRWRKLFSFPSQTLQFPPEQWLLCDGEDSMSTSPLMKILANLFPVSHRQEQFLASVCSFAGLCPQVSAALELGSHPLRNLESRKTFSSQRKSEMAMLVIVWRSRGTFKLFGRIRQKHLQQPKQKFDAVALH